MGLVLRQSVRLVSFGLAAGVSVAFLASRVLSKFLFGVDPGDPLTIVAVSLLLLFTALLAGYVPARRAAHIDPIMALRAD
jgi:ABC-type antimicrobial peptide transport system permease subunit